MALPALEVMICNFQLSIFGHLSTSTKIDAATHKIYSTAWEARALLMNKVKLYRASHVQAHCQEKRCASLPVQGGDSWAVAENAQNWREAGRVQQWWNVEIESCKSH